MSGCVRSPLGLQAQSIGKCSASLFERATIAAYFALSICVSRWLVSLTSVPHQTFMRVTEGASSGFSSLCGAVALFAATKKNAAKALLFGRLACFGLGVCAISFTLGQSRPRAPWLR